MPKDKQPKLPKLGVTCSSTNCKIGLHYFGPAKRKESPHPVGTCRDCGQSLVEWDRTHKQSPTDSEYTFSMLQSECWRHEWWHREIDQKAVNHAIRKGVVELAQAAANRLQKYVCVENNSWDGRQTGLKGNVIFYAQHATATCCRKCIEYWHGIPQNRAVTVEEVQYMAGLIVSYAKMRIPELSDVGKTVPPIRSKRARNSSET